MFRKKDIIASLIISLVIYIIFIYATIQRINGSFSLALMSITNILSVLSLALLILFFINIMFERKNNIYIIVYIILFLIGYYFYFGKYLQHFGILEMISACVMFFQGSIFITIPLNVQKTLNKNPNK